MHYILKTFRMQGYKLNGTPDAKGFNLSKSVCPNDN